MDPDINILYGSNPYCFKEVLSTLNGIFSLLYILAWFSLSLGLPRATQLAQIVKFSLPVNFILLFRVGIRIRIREHSGTNPDKLYGSERIRIRNTSIRNYLLRIQLTKNLFRFNIFSKFKKKHIYEKRVPLPTNLPLFLYNDLFLKRKISPDFWSSSNKKLWSPADPVCNNTANATTC